MQKTLPILGRVGLWIAISVTVLLVALILKQKLVFRSSNASQLGIHINQRVALPDVDWSKNPYTLVLVLDTRCHFCSQSAPFYQRLATEVSARQGVHLMAALPQSLTESRQYLKKSGVDVDDVTQTSFESLGLPGTPSILLVDNTGLLRGLWVGLLAPEVENAIIRRVIILSGKSDDLFRNPRDQTAPKK